MIAFKHHIAQSMIGQKIHFKCDCIIPLDHTGVIKDYEITNNNEIVFLVDVNSKIIKIGENHPNLYVEKVNN